MTISKEKLCGSIEPDEKRKVDLLRSDEKDLVPTHSSIKKPLNP